MSNNEKYTKDMGEIESKINAQNIDESIGETNVETAPPILSGKGRIIGDVTPEILALKDKPLDLKELQNIDVIKHIELCEGKTRIEERGYKKFCKWLSKRGGKLEEELSTKHTPDAFRGACLDQQKYFKEREYIDVVIRYIAGVFGLSGWNINPYRNFALHLYGQLRNEPILSWVRKTTKIMREWEGKEDVDKDILKITAHLTLKLLAYFQLG
jgi:hypothetical protein